MRENGRYVGKTIYTVLALNLEDKKGAMGLYLSENEGANFRSLVPTDLQTEVQLWIIHQVCYSIKYVDSKHHKAIFA
ncbi:hypothetical protein PGS49_19525 [Yersinia intermedia]|nr:hypothetical protein [Yersinia intermedia]MCW8112843.1 hypothetical protein [Yersinia intermedia]MDA5482818.1 hypothetical protein [Yersinia intermedia]MDA5516476.1 hypothetical protein [Yersinia intermedia]